jgi:excisionase family DNA binding protein
VYYFTTAQAAQRLGLSRSRVLALIKEGKLPAKKTGEAWMILGSDLEKFEEDSLEEGRPKDRPRDEGTKPPSDEADS